LGAHNPAPTTNPSAAVAHNQGTGIETGERSAPSVLDVVVTVTLKGAGTVALKGSLTGTEQFAPFGAPVQLNDAVPLIPAPPIESV